MPPNLNRTPPWHRGRGWWWLSGGVALLVLAVLAAEAAGWPFLQGVLTRRLQQVVQAPVTLREPFRLKLLTDPGLQVGQLRLAAPPGLGDEPLLQADALHVRWRWQDVWRHTAGTPWRLLAVSADRLDLQLVRLADGRASWPLALWPGPLPGPVAGVPPVWPVQVASMRLVQGSIVYRDALTGSDLRVAARSWPQPPASAAGWTAEAQGQWRHRSLRLWASTGDAMPLLAAAAPGQDIPWVPVVVQGRIGAADLSFHGVAADLLGSRDLRGSLMLRGPSLAVVGDVVGITVPTTPPFHLAAALTHDGNVWRLLTQQARVGGSHLTADLQFDTRPLVPLLTGNLGGAVLRLADLGPAIGTAAPADVPVMPAVLDLAGGTVPALPLAGPTSRVAPRAGRVLPDRNFDLRSLHAMDADVQVALQVLDLGDEAIIAPLQALRTHLTLRQGVLRLDDLQAGVAGGSVSGSTRLAATTNSAVATWQADLRWAELRLDQWLRGLQRQGRPLLTGRLAGRFQVQGMGSSTAAVLASLDGQAGLSVQQGTVSHLMLELAGLDVAQALGVLLVGDKPLALTCALIQSDIGHGVVRIRRAVLDTDDSTLALGGQLNLTDETLALRSDITPKDFSPFSLRAPILLSGTLATPKVGVAGSRVAGRLAAALALGVAAPVAALLPFLEFGQAPSGADRPCAARR